MKFSKVLHPEIILNLRGPDRDRVIYGRALTATKYVRDTNLWQTLPGLPDKDPIFSSHLCLCRKWIDERAKIYHFGKDFTLALQAYRKEIPVEVLPTRFMAYFSFAESTVFDENHEVVGAYVALCPTIETPFAKTAKFDTEQAFWGSYVTKEGYVGDIRTPIRKTYMENLANEFMTNDRIYNRTTGQLENTPIENDEVRAKRALVYRLLMNCVLYVNSVDPEMHFLPPVSKMKPAEKKDWIKHEPVTNQCLLPVTLVSWKYQLPREYHVDTTWVDTYMRWQRCGKGLTQVKLIWVSPHERHFKKDDEPK